MPYEIDHNSIRIIGYNVPIKFYSPGPDRTLKAEIFLQEDGTLNIGGITTGGGSDLGTLPDSHFVLVAIDDSLLNGRALTAGVGVRFIDNGPSGTFIVGLRGNTILLYDSGGAALREYAFSDAGLTAALAAMAAGDVCESPAGTISGGPWTLAAGTLRGLSRKDSILDGELTVSDATAIENMSIIRSEDDAGAIVGIVEGAGDITATLTNVYIDISNATGGAYAVFMESGGRIDAFEADLRAQAGSVGYAVYIVSGDFYHWSGVALGTTALLPYWTP